VELTGAPRSNPRRTGGLGPIEANSRILGLDLARALAVLGMIAVDFDQVLSNQLGSIWFERALQLPQGYASALFVVLAGIGAAFLVGDSRREGSLVLVRRALVLFALGYNFLFWAWEEDILHFYGYYFLLAVPCLWLPSRGLLVVAALALIPTPLLLSLGWDFDKGWVLDRLEYVDLWTREGHLRHLFFNGFFSITPWMAFFLWGMWLGRRLRVDRGFVHRAARWGAGVFVLTELASWLLVERFGELFATNPMPPVPLYVLSAAGLATAMLGLGEWLVDRWGQTLVVRVLVHGGQVALSIYLLHILAGLGPFDVWYQLGCLTRPQVFAWWAVFCYLTLFAAHRWRLRFAQGPFEAVYRAIGGSVRKGPL
jgi:uncharacterized protein